MVNKQNGQHDSDEYDLGDLDTSVVDDFNNLPEQNVDLLADDTVEQELARNRPPPPKFNLNIERQPESCPKTKVPILNLGNLKHVKEYTV